MPEPEKPRRHVVVWEDVGIIAREGRTMSGLDCIRALVSGKLPLPPVASLVGLHLTDVSEGHVAGTLEPAEYQYNPLGTVHGGILTTLMDSVMSCAVHTLLPAGVGYSTVEVKANFVRPVRVDTGTMHCEGSVVHAGSRIATAECRVTDSAGTLYAHGVNTCLILRPSSSDGAQSTADESGVEQADAG
jgi:uncharacterized protein (TIGR00369 family)